MKPAAFAYHRPASVDEALALLAALAPDAKVLAGGQSLVPMMNMRLAGPAHLVDINDLTELAYVREEGAWIDIGTLTRHRQVADSPLLRQHCSVLPQAAASVGHYAIRQRGTLGGSLAHADPAAQLPLAAVTLDASVTVCSERGERVVAAADFFQAAMTTALQPEEMILRVRFPKLPAGEAGAFEIFSRRRGDYAMLAVAATVAVRDGRVSRLRLGINGASAVPQRLTRLETEFADQPPDRDWLARIARAAAQLVEVDDSERVPSAFRRELAETLTGRALGSALARLEGVPA